MKTVKTALIALAAVAFFASAASARHIHVAGYYRHSVVPNNPRPSGGRSAVPNTPRAYGETRSGRRVNPDEVPPLSPGGQGLAPESR
jgi:hypothetical protein